MYKLNFKYIFIVLLIILILKDKYKEYKNILTLKKLYNKNFNFNKYNYNYYKTFTKIISRVRSNPDEMDIINYNNINSNDVILDIGSGDGYTLLYLNKKYNFKKLIGIEIDKNIYDISKKNINLINSNKIELINKNIIEYEIPKNVNYIYLFNPLDNNLFYNTNNIKYYNIIINNIIKSYLINNRFIYVIFINISQKLVDLFSNNFLIIKHYCKLFNYINVHYNYIFRYPK